MSDSTGAPKNPKSPFETSRFEFVAILLCVLSGAASAMWAIYQEISEALRQGRWAIMPYWLFAYACVFVAAWIWCRRVKAERDHLRAVVASADTRRLHLTVHEGEFVGTGVRQFFITATNLSLEREIEITHLWVEADPKI
jgi:hypothetical protein